MKHFFILFISLFFVAACSSGSEGSSDVSVSTTSIVPVEVVSSPPSTDRLLDRSAYKEAYTLSLASSTRFDYSVSEAECISDGVIDSLSDGSLSEMLPEQFAVSTFELASVPLTEVEANDSAVAFSSCVDLRDLLVDSLIVNAEAEYDNDCLNSLLSDDDLIGVLSANFLDQQPVAYYEALGACVVVTETEPVPIDTSTVDISTLEGEEFVAAEALADYLVSDVNLPFIPDLPSAECASATSVSSLGAVFADSVSDAGVFLYEFSDEEATVLASSLSSCMDLRPSVIQIIDATGALSSASSECLSSSFSEEFIVSSYAGMFKNGLASIAEASSFIDELYSILDTTCPDALTEITEGQ